MAHICKPDIFLAPHDDFGLPLWLQSAAEACQIKGLSASFDAVDHDLLYFPKYFAIFMRQCAAAFRLARPQSIDASLHDP